ncbi:MAG TPA: hypothetical protein VFN55_13120 [Solirubrobacteraceae bacterium]|nr:hypothetical protein [Solirubrobacteraceae bacterium]
MAAHHAHPRDRSRLRTIRATAAAIAAAGALGGLAAAAQAGTSYLPHRLAVLTNQRYGHDCFWAPPKGVDYGRLPGALPIQTPNLYPDVGSTYFVGQYVLPPGASLTFRGRFPRERYFSWTIFKSLSGGQIGPGDHLRDVNIVPDRGSVNPFVPGQRRDARRRFYTLHIMPGPIPRLRARNTLYTGSTDPSARVGMSIRNYLPDRGLDGSGGAGLPALTLHLPGGRALRGVAACRELQPIKSPSTATFPATTWAQLVAGSADPVNAPAVDPPQWERFWNAAYNVAGAFISDPFQRAKTYPPSDDGGFQSNPDTRYLLTTVSLKYGSVITVTGKLPTFPATLPGSLTWTPAAPQVRYWSLCTGSSPVSGLGYDCVYDQQVPLARGRRYTLVISRPQDRPRNAIPACGYRWLDFGAGENYPGPTARPYIDVLYMRFIAADPRWPHSPQKVTRPGTEAKVMGPYFPHSGYTTSAAFERRGCPSRTR